MFRVTDVEPAVTFGRDWNLMITNHRERDTATVVPGKHQYTGLSHSITGYAIKIAFAQLRSDDPDAGLNLTRRESLRRGCPFFVLELRMLPEHSVPDNLPP
jgi:hypothetical protein